MGYLKTKGITLDTMTSVLYEIQEDYYDDLTRIECKNAIVKILSKRDVLTSIAIGIQLDKLATQELLDEPLQEIVSNDCGQFGVDEALALSFCADYGNIATTNFGGLDKYKRGDAQRLDQDQKNGEPVVNTFLDDDISGVIACSAAWLAHHKD